MATTIATGYANAPKKQGEPPDHGFLYTGKGLDFDGATDYITLDATSLLSDSSGTVSLWFKTSTGNKLLTASDTASSNNHISFDITSNVLRA